MNLFQISQYKINNFDTFFLPVSHYNNSILISYFPILHMFSFSLTIEFIKFDYYILFIY